MTQSVSDFVKTYLPSTGGISWPSLPSEREDVARKLFGLGFVEAHDYWINRAIEIMDTGAPKLPPAFKREQLIRQALAELPNEQRAAVVSLVEIAVHGALFSALTSIDQFPRADLSISVQDPETDNASIPIAPTENELHEEFFDWLSQFSTAYRGAA